MAWHDTAQHSITIKRKQKIAFASSKEPIGPELTLVHASSLQAAWKKRLSSAFSHSLLSAFSSIFVKVSSIPKQSKAKQQVSLLHHRSMCVGGCLCVKLYEELWDGALFEASSKQNSPWKALCGFMQCLESLCPSEEELVIWLEVGISQFRINDRDES